VDCACLVARIPVRPFQANPAEIKLTTGAIDYDGALVTCRQGLMQYANRSEKRLFKRVLQGKDQVSPGVASSGAMSVLCLDG